MKKNVINKKLAELASLNEKREKNLKECYDALSRINKNLEGLRESSKRRNNEIEILLERLNSIWWVYGFLRESLWSVQW